MANYATNLFFCSTENENDLEKVEKFLDEKFFDCYLERSEDYVDGEFYSKWDFPEALINEMNYLSSGSPFVFIVERRWEQMEHLKDAVLYRFYKWGDFYDLCERLYDIYQNYTTMEQAVCKQYDEIKNPDWVQSVLNLFPGVKGVPKDTKSACKRVCMFMRWMVRWGSDVDLGIWSFIPTSKLIVPLDTHVARMARQLGLITVKGNNMRAAYQLTQQCRLAFPNDPAKADFALFGYGITHK